MKVALCLFGLVGGTVGKDGKGGNIDYRIAYDHYKKHILDKNDVDIFIHSWSVNFKKELQEVYKPKKCIIEKQKNFSNHYTYNFRLRYNDCKAQYKYLKSKILKRDTLIHINYPVVAFKAYSRWYSNKKVLELKKKYEIEKGFKYDWVMVSRLDLAFFTDVIFNRYDSDYFYASHWNDAVRPDLGRLEANRENHNEGVGFLDFWFFSNSTIMDNFSQLYDYQKKYDISQHISSRQHADTITQKIRFVFYRWYDHEMIRRYFYNSPE